MFGVTSRAWNRVLGLTVLAGTVAAAMATASAQQLANKSGAQWREEVNGGTVRIITKGLQCTCSSIASDMSKVLNEMGEIRVLPVLGHGSLQGMADVLYLKGIDLSIVQSDVLAYIKRNNIHPGIENRIRYVTKLYNSELHLVAGEGINRVEDLEGKIVSYDVKGRGSYITAQTVFDSLGVNVKPVNYERDVAIEKIRTGEIAAAFVVTGKPATSMRKVEAGNGLKFLPIEFNDVLLDTYIPTSLTADDYPNLIPPGESIPTIAVGEVMAVFNWQPGTERYVKLERFIDKFFENFGEFKKDVRHPKWKEVNLAATQPGWTRFPPAEKKLAEIMARQERLSQTDTQEDRFARFFNETLGGGSNLSQDRIRELFEQYQRWEARQEAASLGARSTSVVQN